MGLWFMGIKQQQQQKQNPPRPSLVHCFVHNRIRGVCWVWTLLPLTKLLSCRYILTQHSNLSTSRSVRSNTVSIPVRLLLFLFFIFFIISALCFRYPARVSFDSSTQMATTMTVGQFSIPHFYYFTFRRCCCCCCFVLPFGLGVRRVIVEHRLTWSTQRGQINLIPALR